PSEIIAATSISLELELDVLFGIITQSTLVDFGNQILAPTLPVGYLPLEETFSAQCQEDFLQTESGDYRCTLKLSREIQPDIDAEQVRSLLVGRPIRSGLYRLQQIYPLSEAPKIEIFPQWFPIFPLLPVRLAILVER
ncbi:MAG: hypothetical protein RML93_11945, partial [Anaerolineales bacterium]|nr:hypothetical protein [Anaerolineales bacterium]MDW8447985.1 hypothetical protein [Anaerolineales bacterium]